MNVGNYYGNPWLGLLIKTNDKISLVPLDCPEKLCNKIQEILKTEIIKTSIAQTNLLGIYTVMNSNGIVVPNLTEKKEIERLRESELNVYVSKDRHNALGNNMVINQNGGLINEEIENDEKKRIEEVLGIELVKRKIAEYQTVGSCCISNNKGFLTHYKTKPEEMEEIASILKVRGSKGTVNLGTGFVSIGMIANDNGYLAGEKTSAYELGRIEEALGFL